MNNQTVSNLIEECLFEFDRIEVLIVALTGTNPAVPFLTKYAIIKATGTIEQSFKTIIFDHACSEQSVHVRNYINNSFKESSLNPSLTNIHNSLIKFNEPWNENFKNLLKNEPNIERLRSSLNSLNNARNQFAHGANPNMTFQDLKTYFHDSVKIIDYLEQSILT